MAAFSEYLQSGILNFYFNGEALTVPTNISVALTSGVCQDHQDGSTIPEIPSGINGSGTGYSRVSVNNPQTMPGYWEYQGSGLISNSGNIVFNTCIVDWGTVSGIALLDSPIIGSGKLLFHGALTHPRDVYTGDSVKYDPYALDICLE